MFYSTISFTRKVTFAFSLLLLSLGACSEKDADVTPPGEDEPDEFYQETENFITLTDDAIAYISEELVMGDSVLCFSNATPENAFPPIGSVIHIPVSEKTPQGFLGKITTIEKGNPIKVYTETVPLFEAFPTMDIDTEIDFINSIKEIYDAEGNPVEFQIVDSLLESSGADTKVVTEWEGKFVKIPVDADLKKIAKITGEIKLSVSNLKLTMKAKDKISSLSGNVHLDASLTTSLGCILSQEEEVELFTFPIPVPAAPAINLVFKVYGFVDINGEVAVSFNYNYINTFPFSIGDKREFTPEKREMKPKISKEFSFGSKAEIDTGLGMGIEVGVFNKVGIGAEIQVGASISAEEGINFNDKNLFKMNRWVELAGKAKADLYFQYKLFFKDKNFENKIPLLESPAYIFWSEKLSLFPIVENFEATRTEDSGKINYDIDSYYLLMMLKIGGTVFEEDKITPIECYYQNFTWPDEKGWSHYEIKIEELDKSQQYYAAPTASWGNWTWYGEMVSFGGERAVDLGLSVKWASCNIGASSPEEYGTYYAWQGASDAVQKEWGNSWRLPTKKEVEELARECTLKWGKKNDVAGLWVTGKNGNQIFLPAAGEYDGYDGENNGVGWNGEYWTSDYGTEEGCATRLFLGDDSIDGAYVVAENDDDYDKHTLRAVYVE